MGLGPNGYHKVGGVIQDQLRQAHEALDATKQELNKANEEIHSVKQESRKRTKQITSQQSIMGLGPNGYHKVGGVIQDQPRQAHEAHDATKQELNKANKEIHAVKQESRKRRKQITAQQSIMGLGPNGYHKVGGVIQDQLRQAHEDHDATKQELNKANEEIHSVKQESRKRRKQITAQQSIMGLGPNGYHKVDGVIQDQLRQAHEDHDATKQELNKANEEIHSVKQESRKRRKPITAQQSIMGLGPNGYHKVGGVIQDQLRQAHEAHDATKQELNKANEEIHAVKQESRKRRKQITAQQSIMGLGPNGYHKCPYCEKAFIHATYLQSHLQRKHQEFMTVPEDVEARKENERLAAEMETMRDKLRQTVSQFDDERQNLQKQIENQKAAAQQSRVEIDRHQDEQQRHQMDRLKQEQHDAQKVEMEKMQGMFMKELKEMHEKYSSSQVALEDLQTKYGKQSMLGRMQDEDELSEYKESLRKQQKEHEKLKKQLAKEVSSVKASMEDELKASERRWKDRSRQQKEQYREEVDHLKDRLEQATTSLRIEREGGDQVGRKYEQQIKDVMKRNKETERNLKEKERLLKEKEQQLREMKTELKSKPPLPPPKTREIHVQFQPGTVEESVNVTHVDSQKTPPAVRSQSPKPRPRSPAVTMTAPSDETESEEEETEEESESESIDERPELDTQQRKKLVQGMKDSLQHILSDALTKKGVPENAKGISSQSLENKLRMLKQERQNLAKRHAKFYDIRNGWKTEMDDRVKRGGKKGAGKSPARQNPSTSRKRHASEPQSSTKQQQTPHPSKSSRPNQNIYSSSPTPGSRGATSSRRSTSTPLRTSLKTPPPVVPRGADPIYDVPPNNRLARSASAGSKPAVKMPKARVSFTEQFDDSDEDEEESEVDDVTSEEDSEDDEEGQIRTTQTKRSQGQRSQDPRSQGQRSQDPRSQDPRSQGHRSQSTAAASTSGQRGTSEGRYDDDEDDDDSEWDSEDISELQEVSPSKVTKGAKVTAGQRPTSSSGKPPQKSKHKTKSDGPMVAELTRSIERQLSGRGNRKPAGGVDLGSTNDSDQLRPESRDDGRSPSPLIPTIPDADDDWDDSSLTVSSLDGSFSAAKPIPNPRQNKPSSSSSTNKKSGDTDMSTSNTLGTSMWGSSSNKVETGTGKSSLVSVTDLDDDDDDFDLSEEDL